MHPLRFDLAALAPVVFVTGKGGVGKTTVAAALALESASRGVRSAYVEFGDGESGARALATAAGRVEHVVVRPDEAVLTAAGTLLGSKTLARILVGHPAIRRLLSAAPAVHELVGLEWVRRLEATGTLGRIVVDLPASGHAIGWLRVAAGVARFARVGPFHEMARGVDAMVRAGARSAVIVVTLAEPLVLRETRELVASLAAEIGRGPALLVVNRVPPVDPAAARDEVASLLDAHPAAREVAAMFEARRAARRDAESALGELGQLADVARAELPEHVVDPDAPEVLAWLRDATRGREAHEPSEIACPS